MNETEIKAKVFDIIAEIEATQDKIKELHDERIKLLTELQDLKQSV